MQLRTPGAAIEWVASDGRRGRLMGKGNPRLSGTSNVAAPAQNQAEASANMAAVPAVPSNAFEPWQSMGNGNETNTWPGNDTNIWPGNQAAGSGEIEYKKNVPSKDFSEEEERILMRMKTENKPWAEIGKCLNGKSKQQCTQRFNEIRPDDFYTKNAANKGNNKGGKQGKQKGGDQNKQTQDKKEEKKAESSGDDHWGALPAIGLGFDDDNKSKASEEDSKKDDKAGTGDAAADHWNTSGWNTGAADGNDNKNTSGNTGWTDSTDNNGDKGSGGDWDRTGAETEGVDNWSKQDGGQGADNWSKQDSGKKDGNNKNEGKKNSKDKKGNENSKKKDQVPNAASWENTGGNGQITWSFGEDNKSKSGSSRASKAGFKNSWPNDGDKASATGGKNATKDDWGGQDWGQNTGGDTQAGWGDNKADAGGAQNFGGGWGDAPSDNGKTSKANDSKNKNKSSEASPWNANTWDVPPASPRKTASRASSRDRRKHHSSRRGSDSKECKHGSRRHHSSSHPKEYKVAPDSTFSQDELKLVARILQQDCSMVWERVSWRFKDKTGRNLHPDVFEQKITGRLERERKH